MVSYRHWSVLLWWDPNDVPHRRILPSYEAEWWTVVCPSSTLLMMLLMPGWPTMGLNRIRKKKKNVPPNTQLVISETSLSMQPTVLLLTYAPRDIWKHFEWSFDTAAGERQTFVSKLMSVWWSGSCGVTEAASTVCGLTVEIGMSKKHR